MKRILIYRNPHCARCAKIARIHHAVDWLDRIADTTETPPGGPLQMGEVVVQDLRNRQFFHGAEAAALVYRQAVAYWPLLPLLWIPPVRAWIDREMRGACGGDSCQIAPSGHSTTRA